MDFESISINKMSIFLKSISSVLSTSILIAVMMYLVKIYLSRRRYVEMANKLPSTKLKFYHILGHAMIALRHRIYRNDSKVPLHTTDFYSLNGYNQGIFSKESLSTLWQLNHAFITVYKPESVEVILNHSSEIKKAWFYDLLHPWLGSGLLTSEDEQWRNRRKTLTPAFHFNILQDFLQVFNKQSNILLNVLQNHTKEKYIDIVPIITKCSLDIICESVMGKTLHTQTEPSSPFVNAVVELTSGTFERMQRPWLWNEKVFKFSSSGREFFNNIKIVHDFTEKLIMNKKREKLNHQIGIDISSPSQVNEFDRKKRALLDLLLEEHIKNGSLTESEIRDEVNTFAFEGHDTTAVGMSFALYMIGLHPWVQDQIHQELDSIFEGDNRDATAEDLKNMRYLECVIKEVLRLYPPVPAFGRMMKEDVKVQHHTIPKGATVLVHSFLTHRDPRTFPNPEKFDPNRFLPENATGRHPFAFIPFSAGPRNCIGHRFAMMEEKAVLSSVLRKYRVRSLDPRDKVDLVDVIVLRPAYPLRIQIRRRDQEFDFHSPIRTHKFLENVCEPELSSGNCTFFWACIFFFTWLI